MNESTFEFFDHTADLGVRVRAPSQPALIAPAIHGLYAAIGELVAAAGEAQPIRFSFETSEPSLLLRDLLAEVLHIFECDRQIVTDPDVSEFSETRLTVAARLRPIDADRSRFLREVKAVTYHELAIRKTAEGCEATFIVDI